MKRFQLNLRGKLLLSFLTLIIVSALWIGYGTYKKSTRILEEQTSVTFKQALHQAAINITYRFVEVENLSELILSNPQLQQILKRDREGYGSATTEQLLNDYREILEIIKNIENNRNVYRVRLFVTGGSLYAKERNNIFSIEDMNEVQMEQLMEAPKKLMWTGTYEQEYLYNIRIPIISLFRTLNDLHDLKTSLATIAIDIEEKMIKEVLQDIQFSENGAILVINNNHLITSYATGTVSNISADDILQGIRENHHTQGLSMIKLGEIKYYMISEMIDYNDWEIVALVPVSEILEKSRMIGEYTVYIITLLLVLAAATSVFLSHRLTRELRKLTLHMQEVKQGHYGELIAVKGNDEISRLQAQYNSMIQRIKDLVATVYQMGLSKQSAELKALESQINPHFLYNTLDTIKWMAIKIKADQIVLLVDSMSKFFRLSLNRGLEMTSVANELNHIKAFMNVQEIRYAGKINFYCEFDNRILSHKIIKLILQPMVENAVLHGIQQKEDHAGTIIVKAYKNETSLIFDIIDDGVGMDPKQFVTMQQREQGGYGVKNVQQRIHLYYGFKGNVHCYSRLGIGTCIRICIPLHVKVGIGEK